MPWGLPDIIDRMSESDQFVRLYKAYYAGVLAYARRRVGEDAAADVAAETFLVAWRRPTSVPDQPLPWLLGVARNVVLNEQRRLRRQDRVTSKIAVLAPDASVEFEDRVVDSSAMAEAFGELSAKEREALQLVAWDDLSIRDAATVVDCTAPAFAVRLHRARRHLETLLTANSPRADPGDPVHAAATKQKEAPR
jgi:RNA polymerase sigma-70 factor (ECF subfamily)